MSRGIGLVLFLLGFAAYSLPARAQYDLFPKRASVTLEDPFEVPGTVVEPGTYVFKVVSRQADRTRIQLMNESESQILTTFTAIADHRQKSDSDAPVRYFEAGPGPRPVQTWFCAGEMDGFEFVYPKHRAREIAKSTDDHVLAADSAEGAIVAITSNGTEVPIYGPAPKSRSKPGSQDGVYREKPQPPTSGAKGNRPQ